MEQDSSRRLLILTQVLGALPILLWPFASLGAIMGLAGHRTGNEDPVQLFAIQALCVSMLAYPLTFMFCAVLARIVFNWDRWLMALIVSSLPVVNVLIILAVFAASV